MLQNVPVPVNPRQLLPLFALYDAERGLPSIMGRLDYTGVTRRQVYAAVLGRPPERWDNAVDGPDYNARAHLAAFLNGNEFQTKIREIVMNAFPEKRRSIFIHIPKCAGTDLIAALRRRFPIVHLNLAMPEVTPKGELFSGLRDIAISLPLTSTIGTAGHVPLRWYQERNLVRFEDDLFTVVRNPRDMIYSYISFILTRLKTFAGTKRNDTTNWLKAIGMTEIVEDPSPSYLVEIGSKMLRTPAVTSRNMICNNLGKGQTASALENIILTGMEITDTKRYSAWKKARFGLESEKRLNESLPLFTPELASKADRAFVDEMIDQDMPIYERIVAALSEGDRLSVRGVDLG